MIRIRIGRKKYKGPYLWSDITLEQYIALAGIQIPGKYHAYVLATEKFDSSKTDTVTQYLKTIEEIGEEDLTAKFPEFYKQVIQILTNIPEGTVQKLSEPQASQIFDLYLRPFVVSLIYNTPVISLFGELKDYDPPFKTRIRIGRHIFNFPKTIRIKDEEIPMAKEPTITYTEVCDLFIESGGFTKDTVESLPIMMAIYCRKRWEKYNEKRSLERVEIFKKARMDAVWSLFFYTSRRLKESGNFTRLFSAAPKPLKAIARRSRIFHSLEIVP